MTIALYRGRTQQQTDIHVRTSSNITTGVSLRPTHVSEVVILLLVRTRTLPVLYAFNFI